MSIAGAIRALSRHVSHQRGQRLSSIDRHPDYLSSKLARSRGSTHALPVLEVQHHHAHVAACLAENGYPLDGAGRSSASSLTASVSAMTGRSGAGSSCWPTIAAIDGWPRCARSPCRVALRPYASPGAISMRTSSRRSAGMQSNRKLRRSEFYAELCRKPLARSTR